MIDSDLAVWCEVGLGTHGSEGWSCYIVPADSQDAENVILTREFPRIFPWRVGKDES